MRSFGLVVVLILAGCTGPDPAPACAPFVLASGPATMCVDGIERQMLIHVPAEPDGTLILVLHGGGGWAARTEEQTMMHEAAPEAIVVYPEGIPFGTSSFFRTWNAMHCCGSAYNGQVDDVGFLAELITAVEAAAGEQRVLVTGHSNGAMMAYRFAAERPDLVDAVAAVAGTIGGRSSTTAPEVRIPAPDRPLPVLIIHGRADEQVPYGGGAGPDTVGGRLDLSVADAVAFWRTANNATSERHATGVYDEDVYEGDAVVHVVSHQGGHPWPRGADSEDGVEPDGSPFITAWFYDL